MDRRQRVLNLVRPQGRRGVEIGPLTRPLILRGDGEILYADHLPAERLRRKYADHGTLGPEGVAGIAEVDLVLDGRTLAQALGERGPVDYVVASHVLEHIADPIGWLNEAAEVLPEHGLVCLALPDRRFVFDHFRTTTTVGEMIAAHLSGLRQPGPASVYEQIARAAPVNAFAVWRGEPADPAPIAGGGPQAALHLARLAAEGAYHDAHCGVFTPASFAAAFAEIAGLGLIPFACADFAPTRAGEGEFFVLLRKAAEASPEARARSFPRLDPRLHDRLPQRPGWVARLTAAARSLGGARRA